MKKSFLITPTSTIVAVYSLAILGLISTILTFTLIEEMITKITIGIILALITIYVIYLSCKYTQWAVVNQENLAIRSVFSTIAVINYADIKQIYIKYPNQMNKLKSTNSIKYFVIIVNEDQEPLQLLNSKTPPYLIPYSTEFSNIIQKECSRIEFIDYTINNQE